MKVLFYENSVLQQFFIIISLTQLLIQEIYKTNSGIKQTILKIDF